MSLHSLLRPILDDDHLTRGLGDAEASLLVEWLVARVEEGHGQAPAAVGDVARLCLRARAIARFVRLWCHQQSRGAAIQLAATERFPWPLPCEAMDPYDLMADILFWEHEGRCLPEDAEAA